MRRLVSLALLLLAPRTRAYGEIQPNPMRGCCFGMHVRFGFQQDSLQEGRFQGLVYLDDDGNFAPCLDAGRRVLTPDDPGCRETLRQLLLRHGRLVVKPAVGANSKGVVLLATSAEALAVRSEAQLTASAAPSPFPVSPSPEGASLGRARWRRSDQ